ncbi:MAG: tetratricopeptide repeat protein [Rhodoferax sp.]
MIDVTLKNFETEVIAASMAAPILIDFWSPRSAACTSLVPLLEQLEAAYGGRFTLARVNADEEPQLAQAFGIRSVPTCILMLESKPVDGFTGGQTAGQVKAFLDKNLPGVDEQMAEADADEANALLQSGDAEAALAKLADALARDPGNDDTRYDYIRLLIELGGHEEAEAALAPKLAEIPRKLRFEALWQWLDAIKFIAASAYADWSMAQFDAQLAANKRDFETRFAKARLLMATGEWTAAMDELLEIVMRDKKWADEAPRKAFVAILELLTPPKPRATTQATGRTAGGIEVLGKTAIQEDPQAALVSSYRRKLSMMLN